MSHEDDDGLWDELSHQQDREIAQHHRRAAAAAAAVGAPSVGQYRRPPSASFVSSSMRRDGAALGGGGNVVEFHGVRDPESLRWLNGPGGGGDDDGGGAAQRGLLAQHNDETSERSAPHYSYGGPHPSRLNGGTAARQTIHEASRLLEIFKDALASGWTSAQQQLRHHQQQYYAANREDAAPDSLDEFGIPRLGTSGLLMQASRHGDELEEDDDNNESLTGTPSSSGARSRRRRRPRDYVLLPRLSRGPTWGAAPNLDVYFSSLYSYYYHRGFVPILTKGVVDLVGLFFTLLLSVFLFAFVNWEDLLRCTDEATCHPHFGNYLHEHPLQIYPWSSWTALVVTYAVLFLAYGAFAIWTFWHALRQAAMAQWVFENRLGISSRKLEGGAVDWDADVVTKLVQMQESGEYRVAIHQHSDQLNALVVANRVMRKENFLIAMFNCGVLDLTVPWLKGQTFFCSSIEWVLHFAVLNFLFNHKYQIRPAFYLDPAGLRRRFILCGVVHAIFLPFVLFFLTLHFGFQNAYDWKSTKKYLGPREWSLHSRWVFREFNELPHNFERRLAPSYQATEDYLKLFGSSGATAAVGRVLVFMSGSLGAVLFLFAAINDAILLHVKIADWNLLWYAGVVGVVYSVGKSMVPPEESSSAAALPRSIRNLLAETDAALQNVAKHTHYYLENWKGRGSDPATLSTITSMFKYKANLFAVEVLSVVVAPYILCVSLADSSERICEFVVAVKEEMAGAGEVCGFATFDFDKYADEAWEGKTMGPPPPSQERDPDQHPTLAESIAYTGNVETATEHILQPKTRHGKMEKSFFSFMASHPSWRCPSSGQDLVDRVTQYERDETQAFGREQQMHIEAAARQLETLARWEQQQQRDTNNLFAVRNLYESYIPKTAQAPADAGAGLYAGPATAQSPSRQYLPVRTAFGDASPVDTLPQRPVLLSPSSDLPPVAPSGNATILPFASASTDEPPRMRQIGAMSSGELATTTTNGRASAPGGMSSEFRRLLNLSSLDPDVRSVILAGSEWGGGRGVGDVAHLGFVGTEGRGAAPASTSTLSADIADRRMERQYLWLERYHAHVAAQQRQIHGLPPVQVDGAIATFSIDGSTAGTTVQDGHQQQQQPPVQQLTRRPSPDEQVTNRNSSFGTIV